MTKFHYNPKTGEAGSCRAEIACPFGFALDEHFDSLREATVAAEDYLSKAAGGSFGNGIIENFDVWSARRKASELLATEQVKVVNDRVDENIPIEKYRALMPVGMEKLGDYASSMGLDLQETWYFAGTLYGKPAPTETEYKEFILEGIKKHVDEAFDKTRELDNILNKNPYFKNVKFKHRSSGTVLEAYSTSDGEDLITRIDEKGRANFEVYNHEEGESQYSDSVNGWQSSIGNWMTDFRAHQDHLYLRVLWENEHRRRNERYLAIGKLVHNS